MKKWNTYKIILDKRSYLLFIFISQLFLFGFSNAFLAKSFHQITPNESDSQRTSYFDINEANSIYFVDYFSHLHSHPFLPSEPDSGIPFGETDFEEDDFNDNHTFSDLINRSFNDRNDARLITTFPVTTIEQQSTPLYILFHSWKLYSI